MWTRRKKISLGIVATFLVALIALRLALPSMVQRYVNQKLDEIPEYDGSIGDVDIHLIRGAYSIDDIDIEKTTGAVPVPFFAARTVDFSISWKDIFDGALVGEITVFECSLNFVRGETKEESQTSIDKTWLEVVKDLFPFRINRFAIQRGSIWFHDFGTEPKVDVYMTNLMALCTNLYNTRNLSTELPADFRAR